MNNYLYNIYTIFQTYRQKYENNEHKEASLTEGLALTFYKGGFNIMTVHNCILLIWMNAK